MGNEAARNSTTAIGIQFAKIGASTSPIAIVDLLKIEGAKGNTAANSAGGNVDKLFVWRGSSYDTYYFDSTLNNWVKMGESDVTTDTVEPGDGVFLKKATSKAGSYTLSGQIIAASDVATISLGRNSTTFLCYPWPVDVKISDIANMIADGKGNTAANSTGGNVDKIFVWTGSSYSTYYLDSTLGGYVKQGESELTQDVIPAGAGFFIKKATSKAGSITFTAPAGL
jgi:hypothetical protein